MKRRITVLTALIAATLAIGVIPALAVDTDLPPERSRPERTFPPMWVDQTADELSEQTEERAGLLEERITNSDRLTDRQKATALATIADTLEAIGDFDEPAEIIGTVVSRRQLQRIDRRAARSGEAVDSERHITGDVERFSLRLEHLTRIAEWADAAGEGVTAVIGYLDNAAVLLEIAGGDGAVVERHDAAHIARAWMTEASVALMAM
ncbi:MAG: hypothetical protein MUQ27_14735 [Acidimicrobiia bacterium]|nr:hypothetical protein [Acidimicrobiia bacterium]